MNGGHSVWSRVGESDHGPAVAEGVPPNFLPLGCQEQGIRRRHPEHGFPFALDVLKRGDWRVCHGLPSVHQG